MADERNLQEERTPEQEEGTLQETDVPAVPEVDVTPTPPANLSDEDQESVEKEVSQLVVEVQESEKGLQLTNRLGSIGAKEQKRSSAKINLLKTKVGDLLNEVEGEGGAIPRNLIELRKTMDEINPHVLSEKPRGVVSRVLRKVPKIGDILADIAVKYESVQTQIDGIINGLRAGKDQLLQDSIELDELYQQVKEAQFGIQRYAYFGELFMQKLQELHDQSDNSAEREKLSAAIHRGAMRVQDLRTMEQVNYQFFVSIDLTVQNNTNLSDSIDRTVMVTTSLLVVGLAIQAAMARQKKITKAVQQTQEYASEMLAANAAAIRQQTQEIGDLQNNPVLALEKVAAAYDDLMATLDETERIRKEGTTQAREGIKQLTQMSQKLESKAEALRSSTELTGRLPEEESE
ncbi:MAG: toxic anion resistance protein [Candidatus Bipolaricaulia bacterium]